MAGVVEANSLTSLTLLAANPPQYPRNPTHAQNASLVLYIARVPGSRDVFLTPMKPREKVVTAEDVTSCLYYLHVDLPEDTKLLGEASNIQEPLEIDLQNDTPGIKSGNLISRKPVLPPRQSLDGRGYSLNIQRKVPVSKPVSSSPIRKPIEARPLAPRADVENHHNIGASAFFQGDGGSPRVFRQRSSSDGLSRNNNENIYPSLIPGRSPEHQVASQLNIQLPPPLPPHSRSAGVIPRYKYPTKNLPERPISVSTHHGDSQSLVSTIESGVSLTLIRRDPSSGAQWNVAKIRDILDASAAMNFPGYPRSHPIGSSIHIEILTPGYSKFLHTNDDVPSRIVRDHGLATGSTESIPSTTHQSALRTFQRQLLMEGSGRFGNIFNHKRKGSNDLITDSGSPRRSEEFPSASHGLPINQNPGLGSNHQSSNSLSSLSSDTPVGTSETGCERSRSNFRGYILYSPWNGRCEFATGTSGRSLKCNHILPAGGGSNFPQYPVTVSELRFNLPSTSTFSGPKSPGKDDSRRPSIFSKHKHSRSKSSGELGESRDIEDRLERLDLSLGQENAGGGFGGKQAKLGKLILEDEGLKMMDLIVAANLSLWWRAYERTDGRNKGRAMVL